MIVLPHLKILISNQDYFLPSGYGLPGIVQEGPVFFRRGQTISWISFIEIDKVYTETLLATHALDIKMAQRCPNVVAAQFGAEEVLVSCYLYKERFRLAMIAYFENWTMLVEVDTSDGRVVEKELVLEEFARLIRVERLP